MIYHPKLRWVLVEVESRGFPNDRTAAQIRNTFGLTSQRSAHLCKMGFLVEACIWRLTRERERY
jgi:hypothetical protein